MGEKTQRKRGRYWPVMVVLACLVVLLNLLGFFTAFCDWYASTVYPVITLPFSVLFAQVGIPVGELLMYAAAIMVVAAVLIALLLVFLRKRSGFRRFVKRYFKCVLAVILCGLLLFTLNWSVPFRASPLSQQINSGSEHTFERLQDLRDRVVTELNAAAKEVARNGDGKIEYGDDIDGRYQAALQSLGDEFPRLSGYYPAPKAALCSDVLEWMGIGGYTYPYTQELTYNNHVTPLYYPMLAAHESVHHKGYYLESDAEFLSFLACAKSDDAVLRYSAYDSIYYYVENAYIKALKSMLDSDQVTAVYKKQVQLSELVREDAQLLQEERDEAYQQSVNKQAEEAFSGAAEQAAEQGWSIQSQVLQENTYSGVVQLLLDYGF